MKAIRASRRRWTLGLGLLLTFLVPHALAAQADAPPTTLTLRLDPALVGLAFDGVGAVSAGASSRLLYDYPEPARSRILDLLFKPKYGAGFQQLKVEIGGDINSTDGTEPSHARTREEFLHPVRAYFERGYEGWLAKEARKRNPRIRLDALPWGAPGWVGGGKFFSAEGAEYIASWLEGMRRFHDLDFDYVGLLNEQDFLADYIPLLRRTLDGRGLRGVGIVAADLNGPPPRMWSIVEAAVTNSSVAEAIDAFGVHYAHGPTPEAALAFQRAGKKLWSSEDGEWNWDTMLPIRGLRAHKINRNFVERRLTGTSFWSPVTAYHDSFTAPRSGVIVANTPWSGAYDVEPELWEVAHTTQFVAPGWRYLESACSKLPAGGSVVALASPNGKDLSVIIETAQAKEPQTLELQLAASFRSETLKAWRSDARDKFGRVPDLTLRGGRFTVPLDPGIVLSLTTTRGGRKGTHDGPAARPFPLPYRESFERQAPGRSPRFWSDCGGAFEVHREAGGHRVLRQQIGSPGIDWAGTRHALTVVGDPAWEDQTVIVEAALEGAQSAAGVTNAAGARSSVPYLAVIARFHPGPTFDHFKNPYPPGYCLRIQEDGAWQLTSGVTNLASGRVAALGTAWHRLEIACIGATIRASVDGTALAEVADRTYSHGLSGVGCGIHPARFDNFQAQGRPGPFTEPCLPPVRPPGRL